MLQCDDGSLAVTETLSPDSHTRGVHTPHLFILVFFLAAYRALLPTPASGRGRAAALSLFR